MVDVMISYAREDQEIARLLAHRLGAEGFDVWWDPEIPPGKSFDQVIDAALRSARWVIVLWSRHSVASRWVVAEAEEATTHSKLVPALIENVTIPLAFRRIHAADLVGWRGDPNDPGYRSLSATLRGRQPAASRHVAPAAAKPQAPKRKRGIPAMILALLITAVVAGIGIWVLSQSGDEGDRVTEEQTEVDQPTTGGLDDLAPPSSGPPLTTQPPPTTEGPPPTLFPEDRLGASIEPAPTDNARTGSTPEDVALMYVDYWAASHRKSCPTTEGSLVSVETNGVATAIVDIAIPCADQAGSLPPYSGGFRYILEIQADGAGTWSITDSSWQVYCPRGVVSGWLCEEP
jgi:hypothetical protein